MTQETLPRFQEQKRDCSFSCHRRCDPSLFVGKQPTNWDNDCSDSDAPAVVDLGYFIGGGPEWYADSQSPSTGDDEGEGETELETSDETDRDLVARMTRSATSRLQRQFINEKLIATIDESGAVDRMRHSRIEVGNKLGDGSFSTVFEIKSLRSKDAESSNISSNININNSSNNSSNNNNINNNNNTNTNTINIRDISNRSSIIRDNIHRSSSMTGPLVIKMLKRKLIRKPAMLSACTADLIKEGAILATLGSHPNIVALVGWTPTGLAGFGDLHCGIRHDAFFLVLSRLEMTLQDQLELWKRSKESKAMRSAAYEPRQKVKGECFRERFRIMTDLANAVKHVHSKGILHRDLKPDNVGFDASGTLKLFDFDVARILPVRMSNPKSKSTRDYQDKTFKLTQNVGTKRYMSPECAKGDPYNAKADVYAFGLMCYEIVSLVRPFAEICRPEDHFRLVFQEHKRPSLPKRWPRPLRKFLRSCWSDTISDRPTMDKAFGFFCHEAESLVTGLENKMNQSRLQKRRNSCSSIKGAFDNWELRRKFSSFQDNRVLAIDHKQRGALETATTTKDSVQFFPKQEAEEVEVDWFL